jgi:hypothetical protein
MKNLTATICLTIAVLLGSAGCSEMTDFQKGLTAAHSGDFATALREWIPLAEQGDAGAQNNLGQMYRRGQGVPQDYKTAVKWYRLAAEQGDAGAQTILGIMYEKGRGVLQDYKTAVKWYRLAAEQGYADAQSNLGVRYARGQGVIQDNVYAHMWGNLAASNGDDGKLRDFVAERMTPSQLAKAEDLAQECIRKKYKGCGSAGHSIKENSGTAKKRDDIKFMMEITGAEKIGDILIPQLLFKITNLLKVQKLDFPAEGTSIIKDVVTSIFKKNISSMMEKVILVYDKHFTHQEIKDILIFYNTKTGRKTISTLPSIMIESSMIGVEWAELIMPEIRQEIQKRFIEAAIK